MGLLRYFSLFKSLHLPHPHTRGTENGPNAGTKGSQAILEASDLWVR